MPVLVFLLIGALSLAACATPKVLPFRGDKVIPSPFLSSPQFTYEKQNAETLFQKIPGAESAPNYDIFRLTILLENRIEATYYRSRLPGKKGVIIHLPLYGGHTAASSLFAWYLALWNAEGDLNIVLLHETDPGEDPLDLTALAETRNKETLSALLKESAVKFREAVVRTRRLIDWLETTKETDMNRIGIVGLSTGAFIALAILDTEPRISTGVVGFSGGNLHTILAGSNEPRMKKGRESILQGTGLTPEKYAELVRPFIAEMDPIRYTSNIRPDRILFLEAAYDDFIPLENREMLWRALGEPERVVFPRSHRYAFIDFTPFPSGLNNWAQKKIIKFFREKFKN